MLVALTSGSIAEIVLSIVLAFFLAGYLIRRRQRLPLSWLTVRDGRVVLNDKGRVKIGNRGLDIATVEASIAETFYVDEDGDIAYGGAGSEAEESTEAKK